MVLASGALTPPERAMRPVRKTVTAMPRRARQEATKRVAQTKRARVKTTPRPAERSAPVRR